MRLSVDGTDFRIQREAEAMTFVRKHTSIPVPRIFDVQVRGDDSWILCSVYFHLRFPGYDPGYVEKCPLGRSPVEGEMCVKVLL